MKKIIFLISLLFLFFNFKAFSYDKVEDVFLDINKDYKYLNELQSLYDYWMISPDKEWKFLPNKLITRDEFVWIVMEVSCKNCIKPNTALEYILNYTWQETFFDLNEWNQFFYCIAEAKDKDVVKWYDLWYKCDDWTQQKWSSPFCSNNNITLEEALAFLLRNSSIFTINDNNRVINDIISWVLTQDLSKDVKLKNPDWTSYTFYGYFQKALSLSYKEYDIYWKEKIFSLVSIDSNWNLNPKKYVTKEEFLKMAYIISKINSCSLKNKKTDNDTTALRLKIVDKSCDKSKNCDESDLKDDSWVYDYTVETKTTCDKWIKDYTFVYYNKNSKEMIVKKWDYINDYKFPSYWVWQIKSIVRDNCWNEAQVINEISYLNNSNTDIILNNSNSNNIKISIKANPISWAWPLKIDYKSIVTWCGDNCNFNWNFWDWNSSILKEPSNVFQKPWVYETSLIVTDDKWNKSTATIIVNILQWNQDSIWAKIKIFDKNCNNDTKNNCELSQLSSPDWIYDFYSDVKSLCDKWIKSYNWLFENKTSWLTFTKESIYLDNIKLPSYWLWKISLNVVDNCFSESSVYSMINYNEYLDNKLNNSWTILENNWQKLIDNNIWVAIKTNVIFWPTPLWVKFDSIVWNCEECVYYWDFKNWNTSNKSSDINIYKNDWSYWVVLVVKDKYWNESSAKVVIKAWTDSWNTDTDWDWIYDYEDKCVLVKWAKENWWCPVLDQGCNKNSLVNECKTWFICWSDWYCVVNNISNLNNDVLSSLTNKCLETQNSSSIYWNVLCNTCPCDKSLNFLSVLRKCDILIPSIISKDKRDIYSKWNLYQLPSNY